MQCEEPPSVSEWNGGHKYDSFLKYVSSGDSFINLFAYFKWMQTS